MDDLFELEPVRKRKRSKDSDVFIIDKKPQTSLEETYSTTEDLDYAIALSLQEQREIIPNEDHDNSTSNRISVEDSIEESTNSSHHNDYEDLDHAIALSLQEQGGSNVLKEKNNQIHVHVSLDEEEEKEEVMEEITAEVMKTSQQYEDLDHAIALSLQEQESTNSKPLKLINSTQNLDRTLALSLQRQEEEEKQSSSTFLATSSLEGSWDPRHIIDPRLELEDPHPNIVNLFIQFDSMFFDSALCNGGVVVQWGKRMTRCAGLCCYEGRGGLCSIRLSEPLLKLRPRKDLVETLLHEMIHALLFVTVNNRDRDGHGPQFLSHMDRINKQSGTNITVYHSFHDEVSLYQQHWWKCNGSCQHKKPFFGTVRRAVNRAPSKNDYWWAEHQRTCGGTFIKIKEPEGYTSKKKRKKPSSLDIREVLGGSHSSKTDTGTTGTRTGTTGSHTGTTGTRTGTTGTGTGTTGTRTGTTGTRTGTTGSRTGTTGTRTGTTGTRTGTTGTRTGTTGTCTSTTGTRTGTTGIHSSSIDLTDDSIDDLKTKRENMLQAAERRLGQNKTQDIRTFMTPSPPLNSTHIIIDSSPSSTLSLPNKSPSKTPSKTPPKTPSKTPLLTPPISNREYSKRTCPVCGRNDIPSATINVHIGFCLEEMELASSSDSDSND